jgi:hypothetical protein
MSRGGPIAAWLLAAALGVAQALWVFPSDFLFPRAGLDWMPVGDAAQHMVAQRYLLQDAWRWPPLLAANLNTAEGGLNIAFADGIPILALVLKALRAWLPEGFHGIGLWYGLSWLLQPVAAVWALRGAGEKRLLPALAVALAASGTPAWLSRLGHAALCGHFFLLIALGLHLRLLRRPTSLGLWAEAVGLVVAALLAHPYLAAMALAVLGAMPLSLAARADGRWGRAALGVIAASGAVAGTMALFGYLGAYGDGGFGLYAMNLLSPVWPAGSWLLGGLAPAYVDATGHGGWEGYNWLGTGLLLALAAGLLLRGPAAFWALLRRHAGLVAALAGLSAIAVSHHIGLGPVLLTDPGPAPGLLEQFRASGRFFWPVAYALLLGAMLMLVRVPRVGPVLALLAGLIQFVDAAPLRAAARDWAHRREPWTVEAPALRALLAQADRLTLLPSWPCIAQGPEGDAAKEKLLELLALASERAVPANTMYVARWRTPPLCRDAEAAAAPLAPGELRLILPGAARAALAPLVPDAAAACAPLGELLACATPIRRGSPPGAAPR